MRTKLLFRRFLCIVALCLLGGVNSLWGETIIYDFSKITDSSLTSSGTKATYVAGSATALYCPTQLSDNLNNQFAFQFRSGTTYTNEWSVNASQGGLFSWCRSGNDDNFAICNLQAGDKVTITIKQGEIFFSTTMTNATYDNAGTATTPTQYSSVVSDLEYTIKADGQLDLQAKKGVSNPYRANLVITKIVIERPYHKVWGMDFRKLAVQLSNESTNSGIVLSKSEEPVFGETFYNITNEGFNNNFGINNLNWQVRYNGNNTGLWPYNINGSMAINNLTKNCLVVFYSSGAVTASTNAHLIEALSGTDYYAFQIPSGGIATFTPTKGSYIYSVGVYTLSDNEIVGLIDNSTGWTGDKNTTPIQINVGEIVRYTFKNHNSGSGEVWNNWYLLAKDTPDNNDNVVAVRADQYTDGGVTQTNTLTSFNYISDYNDATVDITISYSDAYNGTYTLSSVTTITKADNTAVSGSKIDTKTGLTETSLYLYMSVFNNWIELLSQQVLSVPATIGANGYTTFASPYCLDLANLPEGLKAYTATLDGKELSFAECTQAVPVGTGLLLAGTGGETYNIPVTTTGTAVSGNALTGVTATTDLKSDETNYIFAMRKASQATDPLTFAPLATSDVSFPAGKAYITVPTSAFSNDPGARALTISFEEATGITSMPNAQCTMHNDVYNLQGQRISSPKKGLYIVNGAKVVIK